MNRFDTLVYRTIARDPAASDWLKAALAAAVKRDPLDALRDAETLAKLLEVRWQEVTRDNLVEGLSLRDALDAPSDCAGGLCASTPCRCEAHMQRVARYVTNAARDESGSVGPIQAIGIALWLAALYAAANWLALAPLARVSTALAGAS